MKIRFLKDKDAFSYRELRLSSLKESPFAFSDSYQDQAAKTLEQFEIEIKKTGNPIESFTLGAFSEDELVGFVKFKRDQRSKARHRASLFSLYVKPNYRVQGIAKELILELFKIIKPISGIEQLQLSTIMSKNALIEFYQRFGFQILGGILKDDLIIENQYVDAIYMVKHLKKMNSNYNIVNTVSGDLNFIYSLFEEAIEYIKMNNYVGWTTYDKNFISQDVESNLQFKIVDGNHILCLFSICYTDVLIWREMEKGDAIYLHRIVVNPLFKGQKQFEKILKWVKQHADKMELKYIRMDTWAENSNIINYYKSFGFKHLEDYKTPNTPELPEQHRNLKVALLQLEL